MDGPLDESLYKPIDYLFRPSSYWDPQDLRQLVANIKGAERKKKALELLEQGQLDQANEFILADTLSAEDREMAGRIDPTFMGGEFLPDYYPGEVEIARVTVASMTEDVTSVRAYPKGKQIGYRVLNEYNSVFEIRPEISEQPLSLQELIDLIETGESDNMGPFGLRTLDINLECGVSPAEYFAEFMDFSSEYYPELSQHFWFATQRWLMQNRNKEP